MSAQTQIWPAPAKINLFLHVTGRRADGYHLLQTIFQFLDYGDALRFSIRSDGEIRRTRQLPVPLERDITLKAAHLLKREAAVKQGADITLVKRLPVGGGLGGASSDAATVLIALNEIWGCRLPLSVLEKLALQLGADVPVFVRGHACWAEGVGELLTPLELTEPWYLVIKPPVSVPTAEIFADSELTRDTQPITIRDLASGALRNDCEAVAVKRYPPIGTALRWLSQYTAGRMSGTGACVFGQFDKLEQAKTVLRQLARDNAGSAENIGTAFIAKGLNRSPLLDFVSVV